MKERLKNADENQQPLKRAYESPTCQLVDIQSEGNILSGSFPVTGNGEAEDMPIEEW